MSSPEPEDRLISYVYTSKRNNETWYNLCNLFTLDEFMAYKEIIDIYEDQQTANTIDELQERERGK